MSDILSVYNIFNMSIWSCIGNECYYRCFASVVSNQSSCVVITHVIIQSNTILRDGIDIKDSTNYY